MCQTILIKYSCGCLKDQFSLPCENPKPICRHLSQTCDTQRVSERCAEHNVHPAFRTTPYTSTQDWTTTPRRAEPNVHPAFRKTPYTSTQEWTTAPKSVQRSFSERMADASRRTVRQRPALDGPHAKVTQRRPARPEQVRVPSTLGLDGLQEQLETMTASSPGLQRYRRPSTDRTANSGRSNIIEIPNRFADSRGPSPSPGIPRRRAAPVNLLAIPVYDNGSNASAQQARRLKTLSGTNFADLGRPRTSAGNDDSSLYPAPLDLNRIRKNSSSTTVTPSTSTSSSRPRRPSRSHPPNAYLNRPLPSPPAREISHVSSSSSGTSSWSGTSKTSSRPGTSESSTTSLLRHDDAVRTYEERQASQARVLAAQRAFDSGRWMKGKYNPELEVLSRDERQKVNAYIAQRRDEQRRDEEDRRRRRRASEARVEEIRKKERKKKTCSVM